MFTGAYPALLSLPVFFHQAVLTIQPRNNLPFCACDHAQTLSKFLPKEMFVYMLSGKKIKYFQVCIMNVCLYFFKSVMTAPEKAAIINMLHYSYNLRTLDDGMKVKDVSFGGKM